MAPGAEKNGLGTSGWQRGEITAFARVEEGTGSLTRL